MTPRPHTRALGAMLDQPRDDHGRFVRTRFATIRRYSHDPEYAAAQDAEAAEQNRRISAEWSARVRAENEARWAREGDV